MDINQQISNPEFEYKQFSKQELVKSNSIIESDKIMIESFYNNKESNYIKLDCYRDEFGKYFWSNCNNYQRSINKK